MNKIIFRRETTPVSQPLKNEFSRNVVIRRRNSKVPFISYFNDTERMKLTKSLFKRDKKKFLLFMDELDRKLNWPDAFAFIDAELSSRKIDIFSKKAKSFTDRIYQVFYPEDISIQ